MNDKIVKALESAFHRIAADNPTDGYYYDDDVAGILEEISEALAIAKTKPVEPSPLAKYFHFVSFSVRDVREEAATYAVYEDQCEGYAAGGSFYADAVFLRNATDESIYEALQAADNDGLTFWNEYGTINVSEFAAIVRQNDKRQALDFLADAGQECDRMDEERELTAAERA